MSTIGEWSNTIHATSGPGPYPIRINRKVAITTLYTKVQRTPNCVAAFLRSLLEQTDYSPNTTVRLTMTIGTSENMPLNILYCHGLGSSINNRMGQVLLEYFKGTPHNFERLVYRNPGSLTKLWKITEWREDIEKRIADDNWIIMATSAGGHCALNAARNKPKNVQGLFLFSPGSSMDDMSYVESLGPGALEKLRSGAQLIHPASRNGYEALVDYEGFKIFLETDVCKAEGMIPINCPVHVVHGTSDNVVPYENSLKLLGRLSSPHKGITTVLGGTHYLDFTKEVESKLEEFLSKIHEQKKSKL